MNKITEQIQFFKQKTKKKEPKGQNFKPKTQKNDQRVRNYQTITHRNTLLQAITNPKFCQNPKQMETTHFRQKQDKYTNQNKNKERKLNTKLILNKLKKENDYEPEIKVSERQTTTTLSSSHLFRRNSQLIPQQTTLLDSNYLAFI